MKNRLLLPSVLIMLLLSSNNLRSQDVIRQTACSDLNILRQADSIKHEIYKQGFILVKENTMLMESEYEMPIIVPLNAGTWYQFVFIGEYTSKLFELRMYDWDEKEVAYIKHQWGDIDGTVIRYSYIPKFSEYHMLKVVQSNKSKKKLCGFVMMFKKVDG
ncbi:hypothetical protein LK994_07575 [Ferruginibacter lapsinanis]|uniref:hypothetical protein n=1 Tax=Ferruginibacter lapsinanis TaxID=563172 RepID=UPI001E5B962E|nr:hypothetical protein [Ferruginibacter lapsinanis]UEG48493.1 hypothetical protein LK994_07575 [Ferruginibacter lapsinanis]